MHPPRLLAFLLSLFSLPLAAGELVLQAPPEITQLLASYLPEEGGNPRRAQENLGEILATEGYFNPQFNWADQADGTQQLQIAPGPRTLIGEVDLAVDGPLAAKTRDALIAGWRLPVGQPFRQEDWNSAKQQILAELLADEYADAQLADSSATIDAEKHSARLRLRYVSGPAYRYGPVRVEGLSLHEASLIDRYNHVIRPDAPYRESELANLQGVLRATPYFRSVRASLDKAEASEQPDGTRRAPVLIEVRERSPQRLSLGAGASSNTGARLEAAYQHIDFLDHSWELASGLRLEQKRQTAYADVLLPPDERARRFSIGSVGEATDIQSLKTTRYALGAQSVQQHGSVEQRLSLQWEHEEREPLGASPVTSRALVPNIMWTWRQLDNALDPHQGLVLQTQIGGGSRAALSDQNFVRLHGRVQFYLPLGRRDTLSLRAEGGRTFADSRLHVPQDYLFRTGGSGSVRGYTYQSLGIKEGSATVGGRYLAVFSAEATHWLNESWGIAAFVDAGDAVDSLRDARLALGYGLGARWKSPAGPLGVDLAYGERTGQLQLHFALAIPF